MSQHVSKWAFRSVGKDIDSFWTACVPCCPWQGYAPIASPGIRPECWSYLWPSAWQQWRSHATVQRKLSENTTAQRVQAFHKDADPPTLQTITNPSQFDPVWFVRSYKICVYLCLGSALQCAYASYVICELYPSVCLPFSLSILQASRAWFRKAPPCGAEGYDI